MIDTYKNILRKELEYHAGNPISNAPDVKPHVIINEDQTEFLLLWIGWKGKAFRHNVSFHFQLKDGKVWILKNNTDIEIEKILVEEGIPKSDIVIGLLPKYLREMTEYGVG